MMPTPPIVYALVAQTLDGVDPNDREAVESFYEHRFPEYTVEKQEIIADFVIGHEEEPNINALQALNKSINRQCVECECDGVVFWERYTQFAGTHLFCDVHARRQIDFGTCDSYSFWKSVSRKNMP